METRCGCRYDPLGGSNAGAAACNVKVALLTSLSIIRLAAAIAWMVVVRQGDLRKERWSRREESNHP